MHEWGQAYLREGHAGREKENGREISSIAEKSESCAKK